MNAVPRQFDEICNVEIIKQAPDNNNLSTKRLETMNQTVKNEPESKESKDQPTLKVNQIQHSVLKY